MTGHQLGSRIDHLLAMLWDHQGTDLILTVGMPPQLRLEGSLVSFDGPVLTAEDTESLLEETLSPEQRAARDGLDEYDFAFTWRDQARIRGNAFVQRGLTAIALRMVPRHIPSMTDLGLPSIVADLARQHQGLILFTGPTNSGKSTSLASVIDMINTERACHIITIEDPIEYVHEHKRSAVNQREVGTDTADFPSALRAAPYGRTPTSSSLARCGISSRSRSRSTVAETGHLVFGTLHTNDTAQSIARVIDVFPSDQQLQIRVQLSAALSCVVYQRLLPKVGGAWWRRSRCSWPTRPCAT